MIAYIAAAGALLSWIVGAIFYLRALRAIGTGERRLFWLAVIAWPFATRRLEGAAADEAAKVNRSLVAMLAFVLVAAAAGSVATNLHRISK
jgi:hypothetical protein